MFWNTIHFNNNLKFNLLIFMYVHYTIDYISNVTNKTRFYPCYSVVTNTVVIYANLVHGN